MTSPDHRLARADSSLTDEHDIIQVSTSNVVYHEPHMYDSVRTSALGFAFFGWLGWLLKWIAILVVLAMLAMGAKSWRAKQQAKRF